MVEWCPDCEERMQPWMGEDDETTIWTCPKCGCEIEERS